MLLAKLGIVLLTIVSITACTSTTWKEAQQQYEIEYNQQQMMKPILPPCGPNSPNQPNQNYNCR